MWHSGSDWQRVPSRFHKKATASKRKILDAAVGQEQHHLGHFEKDAGVGPVQVPLVVVERRPDPAAHLLVEQENCPAHGRGKTSCAVFSYSLGSVSSGNVR